MIKSIAGVAMALGIAGAIPPGAIAQDKVEMKLAYYVGDQTAMSGWLVRWADTLEKRSGGRMIVKRFPGAQMGPAPAHYDLARNGIADVTWFIHGGTPGRFPLTELINLPYMVGSAEIGVKVLNDAQLRARYLDAEHKGVKVLMLFVHTPGGAFTASRPIRTLEDFKGARLRYTSAFTKDYIQALGATPTAVPPPETGEQMQKGTIDGTFVDYGGAAFAFRLAGMVKNVTELYSYVASFGLAMNPEYWNHLDPQFQRLIIETTTGKEKEIGELWDGQDAPGKKIVMDAGAQVIVPSDAEMAKFQRIGQEVSDAKLKELDAKGLPARQVHQMMKALSEKHAKSSKSFWKTQ
jgi:TRAP-type C4-dicarboxylate transport system substrate-binding protein